MLPYSRIASLLDEISDFSRGKKADRIAEFLRDLNKDLICLGVRLLAGGLWPPWEKREMNVGPDSLAQVLQEISKEDIALLKQDLGEMGAVAEVALSRKTQQLISHKPLDALSVYHDLYRISNQRGLESEHRKSAILRGLFLEASPLEGKYIARTVLRNISAGLGPNMLLQALAKAFDYDHNELRNAYGLLPELGILAQVAYRKEIKSIKILPPRPIRPMTILEGDPMFPGAYQLKYHGIRVQLHWIENELYVYTSNLKDITAALERLRKDISELKQDFIIDGQLIAFKDDLILPQNEVIGHINRKHPSKRSPVSLAVMSNDIIFLNGRDLTSFSYRERRSMLLSLLGEPKDLPFCGLAPAREVILKDKRDFEIFRFVEPESGLSGLIARDLSGSYIPGECSSHDFLIKRSGESLK
jgi:DNA ligase 1